MTWMNHWLIFLKTLEGNITNGQNSNNRLVVTDDYIMMNMGLNAIDLFCGCGGMGLGLKKAGFDVLYANDINKDAVETYRANLKETIVECGVE